MTGIEVLALVLHEMVAPRSYEEWLAYDLDVLAHCHGLVRLHGESPGADSEVRTAVEAGLPVFVVGPLGLGMTPRGELSAFADQCHVAVRARQVTP